MTNYIHRTASSKKLRSVILGINYVSGSFPSYSMHSSVKYYWQAPHLPVLSTAAGLTPPTSPYTAKPSE